MKQFILIICLTTFFACKKDNYGPLPEGVYETDGRVYANPVTMYTNKGTITDTGIINTYLRRTYRGYQQFYSGTDQDSLYYGLTFTFQGNTVATENSQWSGSRTLDVVNKTDKTLLLIEHDYSTIYGDPSGTLNCHNIVDKIERYPKVYNCTSIQGFNNCKAKYQYPIEQTADDQLSIPLIRFTFKRTTDVRCSMNIIHLSNYFNPGIAGELQSNDTLLVQTAAVFLKRK